MASVFVARMLALPKRARSVVTRMLPVPLVSVAPTDPRSWIALAHKSFDELPEATRDLIRNHSLDLNSSVIAFFRNDIRKSAGERLTALSKQKIAPAVIAEAIDEIIRRKTILQCAYAHRAGGYFANAENYIKVQWEQVIWPIIRSEDFQNTLEIGCGHGRNTEYLRRYAETIDLVDVNPSCIEACRVRFGNSSQNSQNCIFRYHLTDGDGLPDIPDQSISFVYSWDSMVHFDKLVVRDYVNEVARVLRPDGTAFLHHSNFGALAPNSDWANNHGNRSDMTAELMKQYAYSAGLTVKFQRLSGMSDGWGMDDLDCLSLLQKPTA